ncbi:MAG: hypothetical protein ACI3T9_03430 [Romboutsia timonensis]
MNDMEQTSLAGRLLRILRTWIEAIIPEETKDCIRSKVAVVVAKNSDNTYNVILSEDLGDYLDLVQKKDNKEITDIMFNNEVAKISIDNLFNIKNETYNINDYVIVGYLDNKLTNAFILCKNKQ